MSKERVLSRVEADLGRGDLGKARDRLHTLVHEYPNDVSLRARLAEVYHRLQFPAMAGRYWYLEEHRTPEMESAVAAFKKSCGHDPLLMLSALKFRGDPYQIPEYARQRLGALREAVQEKYGFMPDAYAPSRVLWGGRAGMPYVARETMSRQTLRSTPNMPRMYRDTPRSGATMLGFGLSGTPAIYIWLALAGGVVLVLAVIGLVSIGVWVYAAVQ